MAQDCASTFTFPAEFHEHAVVVVHTSKHKIPTDCKVVTSHERSAEESMAMKETALAMFQRFWADVVYQKIRKIQIDRRHSISLDMEHKSWQHPAPMFCFSLNVCPLGKSCEYGLHNKE